MAKPPKSDPSVTPPPTETAVTPVRHNPMKAKAEELLAKKLERLQGTHAGGFDPKGDPFAKKGGRAPGAGGAGGPPRSRPNKMGARGK